MADRNILEEDILPALAGGGSELLFGIPEWIARQIDEKAVQDYIDKHKQAYETGGTIGAIGSGFIPVAGLAGKAIKGASMLGKAAGLGRLAETGAKVGEGLSKIGTITKNPVTGALVRPGVAQLAARGALEGGIGSAIRTGTEGGDLGENVSQGALFGGAGGALGGMLGQTGHRLSELSEDAAKAIVGMTPGMTGRMALRNFARQSGVGKAGSKLSKIDDWMRRQADFSKRPELKLYSQSSHPDITGTLRDTKGRLEALKEVNKDAFKQIDSLFVAGQKDIQKALDPAIQDLKAYGNEVLGKPGVKAVDDLVRRINAIDNLPGKRKVLSDWIQRKAGQPDDKLQLQYEAALKLSEALDDAVETVAEKVGGPSLKQAAREYGMIENASNAILRDEAMGIGKTSTGSPTFEKGKVYEQLKAAVPLSVAGAGLGAASSDFSDPEKLGDNLKNILLASAGGAALSRIPGAIRQKALAASDTGLQNLLKNPTAQKVITNVEDIAKKVTPGAASALGNVAARSDDIGSTEPESIAENAATAEQGTPAEKAVFQDSVVNRLKQFWDAGDFGNQFEDPEAAYQQYVQSVYEQSDGFDPMKLASILYPDPDDRKRYLETLANSQAIEQNILGATKRGGGNIFNLGGLLGGTGDTSARSAYAGVEGAFVDAAKRAGISSADAKGILKEVMNGPGSVEEKLSNIYAAIEQWDPKGIQTLRQVGLV